MESWEALVKEYPDNPKSNHAIKTIDKATYILNEDLADFEIDWFVESLLYQPIELLNLIDNCVSSGGLMWINVVESGLTLLNKVVKKYHSRLKNYLPHIVSICQLPFEARSRKYAVNCLTTIVCVSQADVGRVSNYIRKLELATDCVGPLVMLVGALFEHRPECMETRDVTKGFDVFLKKLTDKKSTITITKALIKGLCSILKHFSGDIYTVKQTYLCNIILEFLKKNKCEDECLYMFEHYAELFRAKLVGEKYLRDAMWASLKGQEVIKGNGPAALVAIYRAVIMDATPQDLEKIKGEVYGQSESLVTMKILSLIPGAPPYRETTHELEHIIATGVVPTEKVEKISWLLQRYPEDHTSLLEAVILNYENVQNNLNIVDIIMKLPSETKRGATIFLIIKTTENIDKYMPLWEMLLDYDDLKSTRSLFDDFLNYFIHVLKLDNGEKELPERVLNLLWFASRLLNAPGSADAVSAASVASTASAECAASAWRRSGASAALAAAAGFARRCDTDRARAFYKFLDIRRCADETSLRECCKALLYAPDGAVSEHDVLEALQVLFSSYDVTAALLSDCIKKLENIIENERIDRELIGVVIKQAESVLLRKEFTGKEARILNRDVLMLLGKHGHIGLNVVAANCIDNVDMMKLKDDLKLPIDGVKIGMHRVLQLAVQYEDVDAINILINVFSSTVNKRRDRSGVESEWSRVSAGGARVALRRGGAAAPAPPLALLQYIIGERSGSVRAALCELLAEQIRDEGDDASLRIAADRATLLLRQSDVTTKRAGLDLAKVVLHALNDNNKMMEFLPKILINITYTDEKDANIAFDEAAKLFIDKIVLIDQATIEKTVVDIIKNVMNKKNNESFKRSVDIILDFFKQLLAINKKLLKIVTSGISEHEVFRVRYLYAQLKNAGVELCAEPDLSVDVVHEDFELEAILCYMKVYCDVILEKHFEKSKLIIENIVENIPPKCVVNLNDKLIDCLIIYKENDNLQCKFNVWYQRLPLENIVDSVKHSENTYATEIEALNIMSRIFEIQQKLDWAKILIDNERATQRALQSSILEISLKSSEEMLHVIIDDKEFCVRFMDVVCKFLVRKPFLIDKLGDNFTLLIDAAKSFATINGNDEQIDNMLELVDTLWPVYENKMDFKEKYILLCKISQLRKCLKSDSNPLQWVVKTLKDENISIEDKTKLIGVLPGGEEFRQSYHDYAICLPTRIRDVTPEVLRPFLDIISNTKDCNTKDILMNILIKLADDESEGWWDAAVHTSMASAGSSPSAVLAALALSRHPLALCHRVLLPLLRHSTASACEEFFSNALEELLSKLKKNSKSVVNYTIALTVLQVAFEKIESSSLKSPKSVLYSKMPPFDRLWYLPIEVCKLCVQLRVVRPTDDSAESKKAYRSFICANFNCLAAALCKRRPELPDKYDCLFTIEEWKKLFENNEQHLPIRPQWNRRSRTHVVSLVNPNRETLAFQTASRTRTRSVFLRTLSDNPLHYDQLRDNVQVIETQELDLEDNKLNSHPLAATLTALFQHMCTYSPEWLQKVVAILECDSINVRWMTSQIIWNTRSELQPHASVLHPALLAVVASWSANKTELNGVHFDILETLIQWNVKIAVTKQVDDIIVALIETGILNRRIKSVSDYVLDALNRFLALCQDKPTIHSKIFAKYLSGDEESKKRCIKTLLLLSNNQVYIQELLPELVKTLKERINLLELSKLFGAAVKACRDDDVKSRALSSYRSMVWTMRNESNDYIKILYYAQMACNECCDDKNFRHVTGLVSLMSGDQKTNCLLILSSYMSRRQLTDQHINDMFDVIDIPELLSGKHTYEALTLIRDGLQLCSSRSELVAAAAEYTRYPDLKIRKTVYEVMMKAEECANEESATESKRKKVDIPSISPLAYLGEAAFDSDHDTAAMVKSWLARKASTDLSIRFADCFRFAIYLPATLPQPNLTMKNIVGFLDIFFDDKKVVEAFERITEDVRNTVMEPSVTIRTLMNSRGPLTTPTESTVKPKMKKPVTQKHIKSDGGDLLNVLMELYKNYPQVARSLLIELLKALLNKTNNEFDLMNCLLELMPELLGRKLDDVTPVVVEMCWVMAMRGGRFEGFEKLITQLLAVGVGSESEALLKLARNEYRLVDDDSTFMQSVESTASGNENDYAMGQTSFSLKDLVSTFKKMSNWDGLTSQQLECSRRELNTPLWTDNFYQCLQEHQVSGNPKWLDVMVAHTLNKNINRVNLLSATDKWPRRCFDMSAATEVALWQNITNVANIRLPTYIREEDCLAEWAGRLMIRREYLSRIRGLDGSLSRSHELIWCERANEIGLWRDVEACVKINTQNTSIDENEIMGWSVQHLLAMQSKVGEIGSPPLTDILQRAETVLSQYRDVSQPDAVIGMNRVMLKLNMELKTFNETKLQSITELIKEQTSRINDNVSKKNRDALLSVHQMIMVHYDDICDQNGTDDGLVSNMIEVLSQLTELSRHHGEMYLALVLERLKRSSNEGLLRKLLDKITVLLPSLDTFTIETLTELIPKEIVKECGIFKDMLESAQKSEKYKRQLELIADAGFTLKSYCEVMLKALSIEDEDLYRDTFKRMNYKIYDNEYAGNDYQLLAKYKDDLYSVAHYEDTEEFRKKAERILSNVCRSVNRSPNKLSLSQLCPSLSRVLERDRCLDSLLALPAGVSAHKFDEQVEVFKSIRCPCAVRVRLSDGSARRFVVKCGEPLRADAAAQRIRRHVLQLAATPASCYHVTPLSEDSGLIEYLEDHETLRELVYKTYPQAQEIFDTATSDDNEDDLIMSPEGSECYFQGLCEKLPNYVLRDALVIRSLCVEDYIQQKQNFQESVCIMTLMSWILGVGDRHLDNTMVGPRGGARHVDWAAPGRARDLLPARLTRNLRLLCDLHLVESKLQKMLKKLRESSKVLLALMKICFKWKGTEFEDELPLMKGLLTGELLPHQVTSQLMQKSQQKNKELYVKLLERIFQDCKPSGPYSVEEQIRCLLKQCTHREILSVTRRKWEPWV